MQPRNRDMTFTVFPAGSAAPTACFVAELHRALEEIGSARLITRTTAEEALGGGEISDPALSNLLNEQESKFEFLIYQADPGPSAWTSRCMRRADRLLAVAQLDGSRALNEIELELDYTARGSLRSHAQIDLVLLHSGESLSPGSAPQWLTDRSVDRHHHVWPAERKDLRRLARVLTGRAIGLVLGGGGARGFAHIGAIRAIEEAGIAIETIGGTSQGALIAAQYAMGQTPAQMIETNRRMFHDFRPMKGDITLPFFSFMTAKSSNKALQELFGTMDIADLRLPFFCVSANLSIAKTVVHREGSVWQAVRCSMALPVLMPPVIQQGHLIVDGGVLNNLPVDVMRLHSSGSVVAVDVSPPIDLIADSEDRYHLGCFEFLKRKLFRRQSGYIPHLLEIVTRTAFLSSLHHREEMSKQADLCIHPPMSGYGLFAWDRLQELADIGYETTREQLRHWNDPHTLRDAAERSDSYALPVVS